MSNAAALSDEQFLQGFLGANLPPELFAHEGHLRAAWLLLQRHPPDEAVTIYCDALHRLATRFGAPDKFHRTVTEALLRLMLRGRAGDRSLDWPGFKAANRDLLQDARGVLARHYSARRLGMPQARQTFLPPDRSPLPS